MPDDNGLLSSAEKERVIAWMQKHETGEFVCPVCKKKDWLIGDHLVQPITLGQKGSVQFGGIGYPQVMFVSVPCGLTIFMNAVIMGILPGSANREGEKAAAVAQPEEKANG